MTKKELLEWIEWLDGRELVILVEAPKKRKEYKVVVAIKLEYHTLASNIEEAKTIVEAMDLPMEYVENSFEIKSITPEV